MTVIRKEGEESGFSSWLRNEEELDSRKGYRAYSIDFIWSRQGHDEFILLHTIPNMGFMREGQIQAFRKLARGCEASSPYYYGFYIIRCEHDSPANGKAYISQLPKNFLGEIFTDEKLVTEENLIEFLKMEWCNK